MMKLTIKIKIDSKVLNIDIDSTKTVEDLKNTVSSRDEWKHGGEEYVDLYYEGDTPIRGMGKYNIEKGALLQMYDSFELSKFNFESSRDFELVARVVEKHSTQPITKKTKAGTGKYVPPSAKKSSLKSKAFQFSNDEFPPLGA
jgi:hypothetical protein